MYTCNVHEHIWAGAVTDFSLGNLTEFCTPNIMILGPNFLKKKGKKVHPALHP